MNPKRKLLCVAGAALAMLTAASLLLPTRGSEGESRSRALAPSIDSPPFVEPPRLQAPPRAPEAQVLSATRSNEPAPADIEQAMSELHAETAEISATEQARLLRLPVISAIRSGQPDGEARHRAMREALEGSGPSDEPWTRSAREIFESWDRSLPSDDARSVDFGTVRCFTGGCEVLVTFSDRASSERATSAFRGIRENAGRHGGRVQTPPLSLSDDRVQVSWMLLRPDVPLP